MELLNDLAVRGSQRSGARRPRGAYAASCPAPVSRAQRSVTARRSEGTEATERLDVEPPGGFEPPTSALGRRRSYSAELRGRTEMVREAGFEPATSCVRGRRASQLRYSLL